MTALQGVLFCVGYALLLAATIPVTWRVMDWLRERAEKKRSAAVGFRPSVEPK